MILLPTRLQYDFKIIFFMIGNLILNGAFAFEGPGQKYDYDLIIIGGGAAGITAATIASDLGKTVAIMEESMLGGGRVWRGDIPFKILFKKAEILSQAENISQFGLSFDNPPHINTKGIINHVMDGVRRVYNILQKDLSTRASIAILYGKPRFVDSHAVSINGKTISAANIIISTGAHSHIPPIEGLEHVTYFTRENFFTIDDLPKSMIIVGAGPLGSELASALNQLGVDVTLIMKHGTILPTYDFELVNRLTQKMSELGVEIRCALNCVKAKQDENHKVTVTCLNRAGLEETFTADSLFIATGNVPNVHDLDLQNAGVNYTQKGIPIKNNIQTNISHIYACGDVTGLIILSRVAYFHAKLAVYNMFFPEMKDLIADYQHVSKLMFTNPPLACVGLTEQDSFKKYGKNIKVYRCDYVDIERSHVDHNTTGLAKFICDNNGKLLGAHVFGAFAGEILDTVQIGQQFDKLYIEHTAKIRTSPSYFDIIQRCTHQCRKDLGTQEFAEKNVRKLWWKEWLTRLINYFSTI